MDDSPPYPESNRHTGDPGGPAGRSTSSTPRWVKVFGSIALVVVLLFVIVLVTGGGGHGPGRHTGGGSQTAPSSATEHAPPEGGHG